MLEAASLDLFVGQVLWAPASIIPRTFIQWEIFPTAYYRLTLNVTCDGASWFFYPKAKNWIRDTGLKRQTEFYEKGSIPVSGDELVSSGKSPKALGWEPQNLYRSFIKYPLSYICKPQAFLIQALSLVCRSGREELSVSMATGLFYISFFIAFLLFVCMCAPVPHCG